MQTRPILVTGATGKTGARVQARLAAAGVAVRAATRRTAPPFDWTAPDTWPATLDGIGAAFVTYHPDFAFPGALTALSAFVRAARAAGVTRLVLLTGRGERHAEQGEAIIAGSGIAYTIVRSAWFAQNFSEGAMRDPVLSGVLPMPGGDVAEPVIDLDDLADLIVAVLTGNGHAGQTYEATGPRLLTFAEIADILSGALGRRVDYLPISFDAFHATLAGTSGTGFADIVTAIARETFDGRNAWTGDGVMRVLGRAPRDFTEFAAAAARTGAWADAA